MHGSHAVRPAFGPSPALQVMQLVAPSPSVFVTCGAGHGSHDGAPAFANLPVGHVAHSVSCKLRVVPASHGMQKKRWSCAKPDAPVGPLRPAGHSSHSVVDVRVSVV